MSACWGRLRSLQRGEVERRVSTIAGGEGVVVPFVSPPAIRVDVDIRVLFAAGTLSRKWALADWLMSSHRKAAGAVSFSGAFWPTNPGHLIPDSRSNIVSATVCKGRTPQQSMHAATRAWELVRMMSPLTSGPVESSLLPAKASFSFEASWCSTSSTWLSCLTLKGQFGASRDLCLSDQYMR